MSTFNRIRVGKNASNRLQQLKGRTGLTPNILCRLALCYSLNDKQVPQPPDDSGLGQEFNRYTLLGEWDSAYLGLVKERCLADDLDPEKDLLPQIQAHLERGITGLFSRVKNIGDLYNLLPLGD